MESPYDLILGMPWLAEYQPWTDWRTRTVANSTQDTEKEVLVREAYVTDDVSITVDGELMVCQTAKESYSAKNDWFSEWDDDKKFCV